MPEGEESSDVVKSMNFTVSSVDMFSLIFSSQRGAGGVKILI